MEGTVTDLSARNSSERQTVPPQCLLGSHLAAIRSSGYPGRASDRHDLAWRCQRH